MTTAHQSAMIEPGPRRGPRPVESPHEVVLVDHVNPALTLAKIAGLMVTAAVGMTLVLAIVLGGTLFALLNFG